MVEFWLRLMRVTDKEESEEALGKFSGCVVMKRFMEVYERR